MHDIVPLPDGCPWSGWALPDIKWCEENLCAWVTAPANTWSNLGYLSVGLLMAWQIRRLGRPEMRLFPPAALFVGATSLAYHASYTKFFQLFDFMAMYVYIGLPLVLNARRLGWIRPSRLWRPYLGLTVFFSALAAAIHGRVPLQSTMGLLILVAVGQELWLWLGRKERVPRGWWLLALLAITIGAAFSAADQWNVFCDPKNHWLQGHALWHLFGAVSIYALFRFYQGLDLEAPGSTTDPG